VQASLSLLPLIKPHVDKPGIEPMPQRWEGGH